MDVNDRVTVVTVNFKTPKLLRVAVTSLLSHYPNIPYVIVDNGGCKDSLRMAREFAKRDNITAIENPKNKYHGPGMNQGIRASSTPYVFTLDSDTRVDKGGFLELMLSEFEQDERLFALGWLRYVGPQGVASPKQRLKRGKPYVHPYACLLDRGKFLSLKARFLPAGAPSVAVMHEAVNHKGYHLKSFPIDQYIWHMVSGTRGRFGGEFLPRTDQAMTRWRKHRI